MNPDAGRLFGHDARVDGVFCGVAVFRREDIRKGLKKEPFVRFALQVTTGERFTVEHPENVWLGERTCHLGLFKDDVFVDWVDVAIAHIVKIEPENGAAPNGRRRRRKGQS